MGGNNDLVLSSPDMKKRTFETPGFFGENSQSGLYAGIGYSRVTVETNESLGTGSTYGNKKVNGTTYEVGYKQKFDNGYLIKIAGNYTDYGHVTLTGSADNATPVGQRNIIDADTEVYGVKLSVGYQF